MSSPESSAGLVPRIKNIVYDNRTVGIVLFVCTTVSLFLSNLPAGHQWLGFWHKEIPVFESLLLPHNLLHFINDGFMAVFFFLAGMEIKREMAHGELSSAKKASLPLVAALGGMIMPAMIFSLFNRGTAFMSGWAIPASTDIAFSLGVAALLGKKVPYSLRIFLTALAIIDDLGAIIIIAFFYGGSVKSLFLAAAILVFALAFLLNRRSKKFGLIHLMLGILFWYLVLQSGIHATVAGVAYAFLVPTSLLSRLEHQLLPYVNLIIIPIFALANTAIVFPKHIGAALGSGLSFGIILGLFIGKPLGIFAASYLAVIRKKSVLPTGIGWNHIIGIGLLAGIGFTMSIFISALAFSDNQVEDIAKIAVLAGSALSLLAGYFWLNRTGRPAN